MFVRRLFLVVLFTQFLVVVSFSQVTFDKGYFIDNTNHKIECFVKNLDWKNNPETFDYKLSSDNSVMSSDIRSVKEFGIYGSSKYIRYNVKIDRSSDEIKNMNDNRNPEFKEEELFLKVLIEGKASLYVYMDGVLIRFFYKIDESGINQLIYKGYINEDWKVIYNNTFRQQLFSDLKSDQFTSRDFSNLRYEKNSLEHLFIKYNENTQYSFVNYEAKKKQKVKGDFFNLSFRPGVNYSSLSLENSEFNSLDVDFGNGICFRLGVEAELILPFNNNKWSLFTEPTFQYFKNDNERETSYLYGSTLVSKVDYKVVELPVGLRHYFFLNEASKVYINGAVAVDINLNSSLEQRKLDGTLVKSFVIANVKYNLSFGLGYKYNDKFSLEMQCHTNQDILEDYASWKSECKVLSFIFGYSIF